MERKIRLLIAWLILTFIALIPVLLIPLIKPIKTIAMLLAPVIALIILKIKINR